MEDEIIEQPPLWRRLVRVLSFALAGILVLAIVFYFVATSSGFVKSVLLPRVGKSLNAEISVGDVSVSPFSQIVVNDLKIQGKGREPFLTASLARIRFNLISILRGNYVVNELTLTKPVIQIIHEPNGTSNLEPITQNSRSTTTSSKSEGPPRLSFQNIAINDGTVRLIDKAKDGSVDTTELSQINLGMDRFENGQSGKLKLAALAKVEKKRTGGALTNDFLESKLTGDLNFNFDASLLPQTVSGSARLDFSRAQGAYAELSGLAGNLQINSTPTEIRQLALNFERNGKGLGRVQASGPLDLAKMDGRLKLEIQAIDRQVLNLFGAGRGWDFANTSLNATNVIDLSRQGEVISARGQVSGREVGIRQKDLVTPPLDLDVDYEVSVNLHEKTATASKLILAGKMQKDQILKASLDRPMTFAWAGAARGFAESTFQVALGPVKLSDWQAILGTNLPTGTLNFDLSVLAKNDGQLLTAKATGTVEDLTANFGTNRIQQANVSTAFQVRLDNFKMLNLDPFRLDVQQQNQSLLKATGSAHYDFDATDLNLQTTSELGLPALLRQFPYPDLSASNGVLRLSSSLTVKNGKQSITGNLLLGDFTGRYGSYLFDTFDAGLDYNVNVEGAEIDIQSASLTMRRSYASGGVLSAAGKYNQTNRAMHLTFKIVDLNQNALGSFLAPSLGEKKLVSISLNGSGSTSYEPNSAANLKADFAINNWVVANPEHNFRSPVLTAQAQLDGSWSQQILDLRQLLVKLSPTTRAKNELQMKARLDLAATNATPSQLNIQAESLDLTPYYDMFAGKPTNNTPLPSAKAPTGATPAKVAEPAAAHLPIQSLAADAKIDRLYLRDVSVTNFQASAKVNHDEVTLQPLQFNLNGGSVAGNAVFNLGVPGYTYNVSLKGNNVPLEPLANTFTTNAPGTYKGNLSAQIELKGAGTGDPILQKNLAGNLALDLTNMNYEIVGVKTKRLLEPIAAVLNLPELMQTPLNSVGTKAEIGSGRINLQQFTVQSQAFFAGSTGVVVMADVLTNSPLNLPVNLSLRRALAERAHLSPVNTPTNVEYVPLPTFVTLGGTLGNPKSEINKLVIGGLLARSLGSIPQLGGKAGNVLQGVGNMLTSKEGQTNAVSGTNAASPSSILEGVSSLLSRPKTNPSATNAPPTSTNKTSTPNLLDLLNKTIPEKKR